MKLTDVLLALLKIFASLFIAAVYSDEEGVLERIVNITKSPNDKRLYRGLKLSNELKVLLVHDPSAKKSMVSLVAGVGALNDFIDVHGLANLVGYMLIFGDECCPEHGGLYNFIRTKGGGLLQMPFTREHDQAFNFEVNSTRLEEALGRFVRCFREPQFAFNQLEIALNVLESEFVENSKQDSYRYVQVEKTFCSEKNAYGHLFIGNRETLFKKTRNAKSLLKNVKTFYSTWYSSNTMTLAVLGKQDLDELERIVVPQFNTIKNKGAKKFIYTEENHPWAPDKLGYKIYIMPLKEKHVLYLKFPVPDCTNKYKTAPEQFISDLILLEENDPGNLSFILDKTGLCTNLRVDSRATVGIGFFSIYCSLTIDGVRNVDTVINLIFQYIHLISEEGVKEPIFDGYKRRRFLHFYDGEYNDVESSIEFVENLAMSMQTYPLEDILSFDFIKNEWDQPLIERYLERLTPSNMNVSIISPLNLRKVSFTEKHCATIYGFEKIPDRLIEKWSKRQYIPSMKLPKPNEFIPENFDLYPEDPNEQKRPYPYLLHESSKTEIWFKQDDVFRVPKLYVTFDIFSSVPRLSPFLQALWYVMLSNMSASIEKSFGPAEQAGFLWNFIPESSKIKVKLYGFSDKLPLLLERLLSIMNNFKMITNHERMKEMAEELMQERKKPRKDYGFQIKWYSFRVRMNDSDFVKETNVLKHLPKDLKIFQRKLFKRLFIRGFIHGNCTKQKAIDIVHIFENSFKSSTGLLLQEIMPPRAVEISGGPNYVYQVFNKNPDTYAYSFQFELGDDQLDMFNYVAGHLLYEAIKTSCDKLLSDLAQKQSSNVDSFCLILGTGGVRNFTINVVSRRHPRYVDSRIENFLRDACNALNNMPKNQFDQLKSRKVVWGSLISGLDDSTEQYLFEIESRCYIFNRSELVQKELHSVEKKDMHNFCKEKLLKSTSQRRMTSIYILPRKMWKTKPSLWEPSPGVIHIENLQNFSNSSTLLPAVPVKEHSTQLATENESTSSKDGVEQNIEIYQLLQEPVQITQESATKATKQKKVHQKLPQIFERRPENSAEDEEIRIKPHKVQTFGENIIGAMNQEENIHDQESHKIQTMSKNTKEEGEKVSHYSAQIVQTLAENSAELTKQEEVHPQLPQIGQTRSEEMKVYSRKRWRVKTSGEKFIHNVNQGEKIYEPEFDKVQSVLKNLKENDEQEEGVLHAPAHTFQTLADNLVKIAEQKEEENKQTQHSIQIILEKLNAKQEKTTTIENLSEISGQTEKLHMQTPPIFEIMPENVTKNVDQERVVCQEILRVSKDKMLNRQEENLSCQPVHTVQTSADNSAQIVMQKERGGEETPDVVKMMPESLYAKPKEEVLDQKSTSMKNFSKIGEQTEESLTETSDQEREMYQQLPQSLQTVSENEMSVDAESGILLSTYSFSPETLHFYPVEEDETANGPYFIYKSSKSEFWFKQDSHFQPSNLDILFDIFCPMSRLHPANFIMVSIFASLLKSIMIEKYGYYSKFREIEWHIDANSADSKIEISFSGFNDRMPAILENLSLTMTDMEHEVDEELFAKERINYLVSLNSEIMRPYQLNWYFKNILNQHAWTIPDLIGAATLKFDAWKKFLRKLFSGVFIRGLIMGNGNKELAKKIVEIIERPFKSSRGFLPQEILATRVVQLNDGAHFTYLFNREPNTYNYWEYFQFNSESSFDKIANILGLLLQLIIENLETHKTGAAKNVDDDFHVHRHCEILTEGQAVGLLLLFNITSKKFITPATMEAYAENFLHRLHDLLKNLNTLQFHKYKEVLQNKLTMDTTNTGNLVRLFWEEILTQKYYFERREVMVDELIFISQKDMLAFFEETLERSSSKLTMYSFPETKKQDVLSKIPARAVEITDFTNFKNASTLLPLTVA